MDIEDIINCRYCSRLFPDNIEAAKPLYIALMLKFHPDRCSDPRAVEACAVINEMYKRIENYRKYKTLSVCSKGNMIDFPYLMDIPHGCGTEYISEKDLCILISSDDAAESFSNSPAVSDEYFRRHTNKRVLREAESFLPLINRVFGTNEGILVYMKKKSTEIPLSAVLKFHGGKLESRHAAWIISRLLGICCYAEIRNIVWNCINEENLLIDPVQHTVRINFGWWFACGNGERLCGVQSSVYEDMSVSCRLSGIAEHTSDLECVKAVCRRIFPDDAPDAVKYFYDDVCSADAFTEMEKWEHTLIKAFGGRKFCEFAVSMPDIKAGF
ncbi:MAG: hypothetical protein IJ666_07990 [Ruminococcus sp.]|nr:hypothetical protein [Ruminococcus sp.]